MALLYLPQRKCPVATETASGQAPPGCSRRHPRCNCGLRNGERRNPRDRTCTRASRRSRGVLRRARTRKSSGFLDSCATSGPPTRRRCAGCHPGAGSPRLNPNIVGFGYEHGPVLARDLLLHHGPEHGGARPADPSERSQRQERRDQVQHFVAQVREHAGGGRERREGGGCRG